MGYTPRAYVSLTLTTYYTITNIADNDLRALPATKLVSLPNLRYLELGGNPHLDRWSLLTVLEGVSLGCDCGQWSSSFPTSDAAWQGVMEMVDPIPEICSCIGKSETHL